VRPRAATLYTAPERLRGEELIKVDHEEVVDTWMRPYYQLTPAAHLEQFEPEVASCVRRNAV
jgi:hypothetical protein